MFSWGVLTIAATLVVLAYYLNDGGPRYKLQRKPLTEYDYVIGNNMSLYHVFLYIVCKPGRLYTK